MGGIPSEVASKGAVTGLRERPERVRYRRIYLGLDGRTLWVDENGARSKISIQQDGKGFKVGCTRVDEDAMWKIIDFVQGRPTP